MSLQHPLPHATPRIITTAMEIARGTIPTTLDSVVQSIAVISTLPAVAQVTHHARLWGASSMILCAMRKVC